MSLGINFNDPFFKRIPLEDRSLFQERCNGGPINCVEDPSYKVISDYANRKLSESACAIKLLALECKSLGLATREQGPLILPNHQLSEGVFNFVYDCFSIHHQMQKPFGTSLVTGKKEMRNYLLKEQLASDDTWIFVFSQPLKKEGERDLFSAVLSTGMLPCVWKSKTCEYMIIPSPALWAVFLKSQFGDQAIHPVVGLGYSHREKLSDWTQRVVGITGRFAPGPQRVHKAASNPPMLYLHDLYHHFVDSTNPHRKFWVLLARYIRDIKLPEEADCNTVGWKEHLRQAFLDRDMQPYAYTECFSVEQAFWMSLARCLTYEKLSDESKKNVQPILDQCTKFILTNSDFLQISRSSIIDIEKVILGFSSENHPLLCIKTTSLAGLEVLLSSVRAFVNANLVKDLMNRPLV